MIPFLELATESSMASLPPSLCNYFLWLIKNKACYRVVLSAAQEILDYSLRMVCHGKSCLKFCDFFFHRQMCLYWILKQICIEVPVQSSGITAHPGAGLGQFCIASSRVCIVSEPGHEVRGSEPWDLNSVAQWTLCWENPNSCREISSGPQEQVGTSEEASLSWSPLWN